MSKKLEGWYRPEQGDVDIIEYWYDRAIRCWTIQLKDGGDHQIGDAEYEPRIDEAKITVKRLSKEYPNAKVIKTKAT